MARPLRIELQVHMYHVTARGDEQEDIYLDDEQEDIYLDDIDRGIYLEVLADVPKTSGS